MYRKRLEQFKKQQQAQKKQLRPQLTNKQIKQRIINEIKIYFALRKPRKIKLPPFLKIFKIKKTNEEQELLSNIVSYAREVEKESKNLRADLSRIISIFITKDTSLKEEELKKILAHLESYTNVDEKKLVYKLIEKIESFFSQKSDEIKKKSLNEIETFVDKIIYGEEEVSYLLDSILRKCHFVYYYPNLKESKIIYGTNQET